MLRIKRKPLCYAPFSSIYIDKEGNVTACCFNRKDVYGNIYQQSLDEIWNSAVAEDLRQSMLHGEFPEGCWSCKEAIIAGNYYNSGVYTYRQFKFNGVLQNIDFELTHLCNFRCVMCYLHSNTYDLNEQTEESLLNNLRPYIKQLTHTRFYGGEPLVIPIYKKIWQLIVQENPSCRILVQTNGSIVNESLKELFRKGNFIFNISIDSVKDDLYASIRKNGNLQNVLQNMQILKRLSKHKVSVIITPMTLNAYELPSIVKFFSRQNIPVFFNFLIYPEKYSLKFLNKEEFAKLLEFYSQERYLPTSYVKFFNWLKWRQLQKQLYYHYEQMNNYSEEELNSLSESLYEYLLEKHLWTANYDKQILIAIIKRLLLTNIPDELKKKITFLESDQMRAYIERKIEEERL